MAALGAHGKAYPAVILTPTPTGIAAAGILTEGTGDVVRHGLAWLGGDFRDGPSEPIAAGDTIVLESDQPINLEYDGELGEIAVAGTFRAGVERGRFHRHRMTRLFHISDLHFGLEDRTALHWFKGCVRREQPDAVLITGDLTMRARAHEFAAACDWIEGLDVPVTVEVGNHDLPYFNPFARFFWPYRRIRRIERLVERRARLAGVAVVAAQDHRARAMAVRLVERLGHPQRARQDADRDRCAAAGHARAGHRASSAGRGGDEGARAGPNGGLLEFERSLVDHQARTDVHDAFDLLEPTAAGPIRMIGAGTLSQRIRSTPPSFNELRIKDRDVVVRVRSIDAVPTPDMQISDVPPDALPPREPGEPVAPVGAVPPIDPPVH